MYKVCGEHCLIEKHSIKSFSIVKILSAVTAVTLIGLAGWYVVASRSTDDLASVGQSQDSEFANSRSSNDSQPDEEVDIDQNTEIGQSKTPAISTDWVLSETQFGNFYLPKEDGGLALQEQYHETDKTNDLRVNGGFLAELMSYNIRFFDLSNPLIDYNHGNLGYYPCAFDASTYNFNGALVVNPAGPDPYSTTDERCNIKKDTISIGGKDFLDVSFSRDILYQSGYLTMSADESYLLSIRAKSFTNPDCFEGEAFIGNCDHLSESVRSTGLAKDMSALREFIEEFIRNNPDI